MGCEQRPVQTASCDGLPDLAPLYSATFLSLLYWCVCVCVCLFLSECVCACVCAGVGVGAAFKDVKHFVLCF